MAQDYARIKTSIWLDEDFISLPAPAQRLYQLIVQQPEVTLCGVIQPAVKRWNTFAPDTTLEGIECALTALQNATFVVIDDITDELLIRSFVRHGVALSSPNAIVGMSKAFGTIRSEVLRKVVIEELQKVPSRELIESLTRDIPDGDKPPLRSRLSNSFLTAWDTGCGAYS